MSERKESRIGCLGVVGGLILGGIMGLVLGYVVGVDIVGQPSHREAAVGMMSAIIQIAGVFGVVGAIVGAFIGSKLANKRLPRSAKHRRRYPPPPAWRL